MKVAQHSANQSNLGFESGQAAEKITTARKGMLINATL